MNLPKTADGATLCYGDKVYSLYYETVLQAYCEPKIDSLVINTGNLTLKDGFWYIHDAKHHRTLSPGDVYRDRRRLVTICRDYWKKRVKEVRAKLKVWNDDVKIRRLCNVIQANQT
jgi:hypothetical protein